MAHAMTPGGEGDSARFPYGPPCEPARFPQGYPPGALYRPHPAPAPLASVHAAPDDERPRGVRHRWESPLLAAAIAVTAGAVALLGLLLWTRPGVPPIGALVLLGVPLAYWLARGLLHAARRAQGIKVSPTQFPEAHRMVRELSVQMGLHRAPEAYVLLGNGVVSTAASGHGFRRYVVVHSDLFEVGGRLRDPEALRFLIAHELGHIAAGHTAYWRQVATSVATVVPVLGSSLSRAMEYTADNHAYAHCPEGAHGIRVLAGGKYLYPHVNLGEMADRARTERGFFLFLHNLLARHPTHIKRMAAIRDRGRPGRVFH
ncbi:Zn-dependent protease with chaperone function [Spinactinospora alkalitolerans]|uniref:Zn-dependent protease with chaperone function n=1 Tax=Spinactinospora alkalitolerans TaxID=687207 RepID=A0A852TSW9_9ACTN|nr:M48 family metallopeptidase [Spinactinospora alkalitolerans]NYE45060.1 Zn-dependent protease with chaperone function [Spinactinospora alkalitolerans]